MISGGRVRVFFAAIAPMLLASQAWAGSSPTQIWSPSSVASVSTATSAVSSTSRMIDHSGLATGFTSGVTDFSTYISSNPLSGSSDTYGWASAAHTNSFSVIFDMGQILTMSSLALWGSGATDANITAFSLLASDSVDFATSKSLGAFTANMARTGTSYGAYTFNFAATTSRYLELQVTNGGTNSFTTEIGEVAVSATAANVSVPEPEGMLIFGIGTLGLMIARRRRLT